jgi:putative membrane-bound dehydrogenase-like protein
MKFNLVNVIALGWLLAVFDVGSADEFPTITNTQKQGEEPPSPLEATEAISVPDGFKVTLFAGEPDVRQPIAFDIDDRGRLWVAECYTYTSRAYDKKMRDRLVVLEDTDQDGRFDKRFVFWDQGTSLTSVTLGYGYIWILNNGRLQRIPDRDGDDKPDGHRETLLDGFNVQDIGHNIVNGLRWGPDGWLYGRHGITATSYVGVPGTPHDARTTLNCCIWRYHPFAKKFEVVINGTTNPWGLDYDEHGEFFFTNNVIGHLWHVVPGAHFERMFGVDFNPYLYELMPQTADHYHWDNEQAWTDSREAKGVHEKLGGGHSHCGGMIYLGDNWPAEYRGSMFMCNTHGRRVNQNRLERVSSSYVAKRAPDMLVANQSWFRGVDLNYGPDGGVFVSDWSDLGECHDHDGVHRTSGRIYKVVHTANWKPAALPRTGLDGFSNAELIKLQQHSNEWYVRHSRRLLHERHLAGNVGDREITALRQLLRSATSNVVRLRGLWALNLLGQLEESELIALLSDADEHLVVWAIRLLAERESVSDAAVDQMQTMARQPMTGLIASYLASVSQRLTDAQRWQLTSNLAHCETSWMDDKLQLLVWYGMEPTVVDNRYAAIELAVRVPHSRLARFVARRLCERWSEEPKSRDQLLAAIYHADGERQRVLLDGVQQALRGRRKVAAPRGWSQFAATIRSSKSQPLKDLVENLQVVFGDGVTMHELLKVANDGDRSTDERRRALEVLIENSVEGTSDVLFKLVNDRALATIAVAGLANFDHPQSASRILDRWRLLDRTARLAAVNTLASRGKSARQLSDAIASGKVAPEFISAFQARQLRGFNDPNINAVLNEKWGQIRPSSETKRKLIETWRVKLTEQNLAEADLDAGRALFEKTCSKCHRIYGKGGILAPDLTGSNRDNLDYILENVIDPSAMLAANYRMSTIETVDGRILSGIVIDSGGPTVQIRTPENEIVLNRADLHRVSKTKLSLMPDGLFDILSDEQVRDLVGFLRHK